MFDFPLIRKPAIDSPGAITDNSLKSQMTNGMTVSRPAYSRQLRKFDLSWKALSQAEFNILTAFYRATHGGSLSFKWFDDDTGIERTVRFDGDLTYNLVGANSQGKLYAVKISLQEA